MARKPASEQGDTFEDIRAAAFAQFGRYGYDGVSINKIAAAADITKAAIYWHYDGKKELYLDCLAMLYDLFRTHILQAMSTAQTPAMRIMRMFEGVGQLLHDPRIRDGVAGYWLEARTEALPEADTLREHFEEEAVTFLAATLAEGVSAGEFTMTLSPRDMAHAILSLIEASVLPLRHNTPAQTRALLGSLAHTFFRAHAPDPHLATLALDVGAGL